MCARSCSELALVNIIYVALAHTRQDSVSVYVDILIFVKLSLIDLTTSSAHNCIVLLYTVFSVHGCVCVPASACMPYNVK